MHRAQGPTNTPGRRFHATMFRIDRVKGREGVESGFGFCVPLECCGGELNGCESTNMSTLHMDCFTQKQFYWIPALREASERHTYGLVAGVIPFHQKTLLAHAYGTWGGSVSGHGWRHSSVMTVVWTPLILSLEILCEGWLITRTESLKGVRCWAFES